MRRSELIQTLVALAAGRPATLEAPRPAAGSSAPAFQGARVLVAEDNTVNQKVAAAMMKRLGYRVDVVANGREAVEAFERVPYAAILMDCQMPEMNGYEASTEIRRREGSAGHVPIVALTASAIKGDEERCLAAGMDAYVTKPVTVEALGAALRRLIAAAGAPDADVLDRATLDSLWELGGNTPSLLEELAERFHDGATADIAALTGAAPGADLPAMASAAHRLKGSCGAIGATALGRLAAQIEAAAVDNRPESIAEPLARIDHAFSDVRAALGHATAGALAGRHAGD